MNKWVVVEHVTCYKDIKMRLYGPFDTFILAENWARINIRLSEDIPYWESIQLED